MSTKAGRPPIGDTAMTVAERKRRSRERLSEDGSQEVCLRLPGAVIAELDKLASINGWTRDQAIASILEIGVQQTPAPVSGDQNSVIETTN